MSNYKTTKISFDNVTDEQIVYMIQCSELEVTRLTMLTRALTEREKEQFETAKTTINQARAELEKRANKLTTKRMF